MSTRPNRQTVSIWEWPELARCVHTHRQATFTKPPKLRKHAPAVLAWAYRQRYTTSDQVGRRFHRKMRSDRTVRRHLAELVDLGLLAVQPITGLPNFGPKVYTVTAAGRQLLKTSYAKQGIEWQEPVRDRKRSGGVSIPHVWHELAITETCLLVHETAEARPDFEVLEMERRSLQRHSAFQFGFRGQQTRLQPDTMFMYREARGMMVNFLEVDTGTESEVTLRSKLQRYHTWSDSNRGEAYLLGLYQRHGANQPRPAYRLLFIVSATSAKQEQGRIETLIELGKVVPPSLRRRTWVCTGRDLANHDGIESPLDRPVWTCGRNLPKPRTLLALLASQTE